MSSGRLFDSSSLTEWCIMLRYGISPSRRENCDHLTSMKSLFSLLSLVLFTLALGHTVSAAPATLVKTVTYQGETITLQLAREAIRGAHFEVLAQNAAGIYESFTPVAERSYLGTVDEYPGAVSYGILRDDGVFWGGVIFDRGGNWFISGQTVTTSGLTQPTSFGYSSWTVTAGQGGSNVYGYDVGIDARYEYFKERAGGSLAKALEMIEFSLSQNRALYIHDALLRPFLARVIIRTDPAQDPVAGLTGAAYITALRNHWNANQTGANRDVVAGITTAHVWSGLAWSNVIGGYNGFSVNDSQGDGNFNKVWQHELGHNWGLGHHDGGSPEKGTINSDNHFARMSGPELHQALKERDAKMWALDNLGPMTTVNIPPYAAYDSRFFEQGVDTQLAIDVLANDHDANGHALTLSSVQSATAKGGTAIMQGGVVIYTPNGTFSGVDSFTYVIQDSSGQTATGAVAVDVQNGDRLRLHLAMDETTGTWIDDSSLFDRNGTIYGTDLPTASVAGRFGKAVNLDGVDDHVRADGIQLHSNTVTLSAWIKLGATSKPWSGIIFDRSNNVKGLNLGANGELRYHWNNNHFNWDSGLKPTANKWTFVALVIEPGKATMYMNDGSGFRSAVNAASHAPANFGSVNVGRDPSDASRHFLGAIDDVRIYKGALTQAELQTLVEGGGAENPAPFDGAKDIISGVISWSPAAAANAYQIYVGTSETAVANATTASLEYLGSTVSPTSLTALTDQTQYFWRVDTVTSASTRTGRVWTFTSGVVSASSIYAWESEVNTGVKALLMRTTPLAGSTSTSIDLSTISGDATYEFVVHAEDLGRTDVRLLDANGWSLRFEQVPTGGNLGITSYDVADYQLNPISGQMVTSPYGRVAHLSFVVDTAKPQTRVYVDGVLVGTQTAIPNLATTAATLGGNGSNALRDDDQPGILAFAAYNSALDASELLAHSDAWATASLPSNNRPVAYDSTFSFTDNASIGTIVDTVFATDSDAGDTLT